MTQTSSAVAQQPLPRLRLLNVGAGEAALPDLFGDNVEEVRVDCDDRFSPHYIRSMLALGDLNGEFDVVWCSHALEHLYPHEIPCALAEFKRVLKPEGKLMVLVPDLQDVRPTAEILAKDGKVPITGLDLYYGHMSRIEKEPAMAHHFGFIAATLESVLNGCGFKNVVVRRLPNHQLMGVCYR